MVRLWAGQRWLFVLGIAVIELSRIEVAPGNPWSRGEKVWAHTIKTSGDVAATFHLEPNHNPTAGQSTLIWFALTRRGGALIPLQNCQCQLKIYRLPSPSGSPPLLQPSLQAITAEVYQGIPGAEVIFPQIGRYRLELSGSPIIPEAFQPFTLNYEVTVTQASQGSQP